jgi:predicted nucleic acid-binding protein
MTPECLLDTNVLLYAALGLEDEPAKWQTARNLVETKNYATSAQVLAEFYANATNAKKFDIPLKPTEAAKWVAVLSAKPCADVDSGVVMRGIELSIRYKTSYWDGAILAASEYLEAPILYTEDLNHGQYYGTVRVINPFKPDPDLQ